MRYHRKISLICRLAKNDSIFAVLFFSYNFIQTTQVKIALYKLRTGKGEGILNICSLLLKVFVSKGKKDMRESKFSVSNIKKTIGLETV